MENTPLAITDQSNKPIERAKRQEVKAPKLNIHAQLLEVQKNLGTVILDSEMQITQGNKKKYASFKAGMQVAKPACNEQGLYLSFPIKNVTEGDKVKSYVVTTITNLEGQKLECEVLINPKAKSTTTSITDAVSGLMGKNIPLGSPEYINVLTTVIEATINNLVETDSQSYGKAITFAKRQGLFLLLGLETGEEEGEKIPTNTQNFVEAAGIKKICKKCGNEMKMRTGRDGNQFWGCSAYPSCTHTEV